MLLLEPHPSLASSPPPLLSSLTHQLTSFSRGQLRHRHRWHMRHHIALERGLYLFSLAFLSLFCLGGKLVLEHCLFIKILRITTPWPCFFLYKSFKKLFQERWWEMCYKRDSDMAWFVQGLFYCLFHEIILHCTYLSGCMDIYYHSKYIFQVKLYFPSPIGIFGSHYVWYRMITTC